MADGDKLVTLDGLKVVWDHTQGQLGSMIKRYPRQHGIISGSGTWDQLNSSGATYDNYRHIIVPINPGDKFSMTAGTNPLHWVVLKDYSPTAGSAVSQFATGYAQRQTLNPGDSTEILTAPSDAKYLFLIVNFNKTNGVLNDNYPASVLINGIDLCKGVETELMEAVESIMALQNDHVSNNDLELVKHSNLNDRVAWQSGKGVNTMNSGNTIALRDNANRQTTGQLHFDEDITVTVKDGYMVALAFVNEQNVISTVVDYQVLDHYKIEAGNYFWAILRYGAGNGNISSVTADDYVTFERTATTLESLNNKITARFPACKWVALGDSITAGWYSYVPVWDNGKADKVLAVGRHFYMNNVLYRTTSEIAVNDTITVGTNCVTADAGEKQIGVYTSDPSKCWAKQVADTLGWELTNLGVGSTGYIKNFDGTNEMGAGEQKRGYYMARTANLTGADLVTVAYGVNDWKGNIPLGTINDPVNGDGDGNPVSIYGGVKATIEAIMASNPLCRIVVLTPLNCLGYGHMYKDSSRYGLTYKYSSSGTLEDVFQAIVNVCELYGVPYIDMTHKSPVNMLNIYDCLPDGIHPSLTAHAMIARYLTGALQGVYEGASPSHRDLQTAVEVSSIMGRNTADLSTIQQIAASGRAAEVFEIGQTFIMPWTDKSGSSEVTYQAPVALVHIGDAVDNNNIVHHDAMYFQWTHATPNASIFSTTSNDYSQSDVLEWLNSTAVDATNGTAGWLSGVPDEWKSVMKPVQVRTLRKKANTNPQEYEYSAVANKKVFLPSVVQMYGVLNDTVTAATLKAEEGPLWEYWERKTGVAAPTNNANEARAITRIDAPDGSNVQIMLRSANLTDDAKCYVVQTNGNITSGASYTNPRCVTPCFVIY